MAAPWSLAKPFHASLIAYLLWSGIAGIAFIHEGPKISHPRLGDLSRRVPHVACDATRQKQREKQKGDYRRSSIAASGAYIAGIMSLLGNPKKATAEAKKVLVTGANSGIGLATAIELAVRGWQIVPLCRSESKIREATEDITDLVDDARVDKPLPCELADLRSVGACVKSLRSGPKFDALIFNAGIDGAPLERSPQGQELHFAVNHLGHFGLWTGLKDYVKDDVRVVSVTSSAAVDAQLDLDDLTWEKRSYGRHEAYATSKACNVLFTEELSRRFHESGSFASANVIDPGPTATQIVRYALPERALQRKDMAPIQLAKQARLFGLKTPQQAAEGIVWLSDSSEVRQVPDGQWWSGVKTLFPQIDLAWHNEAVAKNLWERSEELVKPFVV